MSKIFDARSLKEATTTFWKPFAELGTAWWRRYRNDIFLQTEVNVIGLQIVFAIAIIVLIVATFSLVYHNISIAIVEGIHASLQQNNPTATGAAIVQEIERIRFVNLLANVGVISAATIVLGYIIARVTLRPAREALESQKQFIGNVAHELRTPLAVIKTNTEVALLGSSMNHELKETLLANVEELDRISQIINNLLSLSTLVRPEGIEFSSVDFSALVSSVVNTYTPLANGSGIELSVRKNPNLRVWGNTTALEQIAGNVIKNAINYTGKGGRVQVTLERAVHNNVELVVQDSGIGIAQRDLFRIFEPFYRADPSRSRFANLGRGGGTGLGLTIVSELVKAHEGRISMKSTVGHGTTVTITLPSPRTREVSSSGTSESAPSEIAMDFSKG